MNLVKTYIDKDKFGGMGLFAAEFIPKGKLIWELIEPFDLVLDKRVFDSIKDNLHQWYAIPLKDHILRYCYELNKKVVFCGDDARFANHSISPNTISEFSKQWAKQDIQIGDEIFCNYFEINDTFSEEEFNELKSYK